MGNSHRDEQTRPKYRISVIARMLEIHPQTIRTYERLGLIEPARSSGNTRLFSEKDKLRIEKIQALTQDMGVNLAGVEIILKMLNQIEMMNCEARKLRDSIDRFMADRGVAPDADLIQIYQDCRWLKLKADSSNG